MLSLRWLQTNKAVYQPGQVVSLRWLCTRPTNKPGTVYQPGQVVRLKRVLKSEYKGTEAQLAWQIGLAASLGIIFIGIPWACNMVVYVRSLQQPRAATTASLQQQVYDRRLENRHALQVAPESDASPDA